MNTTDSAAAAPPPKNTHTELWAPVTDAARRGTLVLQVCKACGAVQYPPREVCRACLGEGLDWQEVKAQGTVLATTSLQASLEPWFRAHLPWRIGTVKLACGPVVIAHLASGVTTGSHVTLVTRLGPCGEAVFVAVPPHGADRFDFSDLCSATSSPQAPHTTAPDEKKSLKGKP